MNKIWDLKKIRELTKYIIDQIKVHESKVKKWSEESKCYYYNNGYALPLLNTIVFHAGFCLLEVKNIDILTYFSRTIEKISDLKTLSSYPDTYDFIVKYQGWIMDLTITPFIGSLYSLTLGQREIIKIEKEKNENEREEQ